MILLTLGTFPLQFNRLLKAVDELCRDGLIEEDVFAQIGFSTYIPRHIPFKKILEKEEFDNFFNSSSSVISHAGMGTISQALETGKPLLSVPRQKIFGELVNDHQTDTARRFEERGHILVAYDISELSQKIKDLKSFIPRPRENQADMIAMEIGLFLSSMQESYE